MNDRAHFSSFIRFSMLGWFMALPPFRTINRPRSYAISRCEIIILFAFVVGSFICFCYFFIFQQIKLYYLRAAKSLDTGGWVDLNWNRKSLNRVLSDMLRMVSTLVPSNTQARYESPSPMICFRQPCHCVGASCIWKNKDNITLVNEPANSTENIIKVSTRL